MVFLLCQAFFSGSSSHRNSGKRVSENRGDGPHGGFDTSCVDPVVVTKRKAPFSGGLTGIPRSIVARTTCSGSDAGSTTKNTILMSTEAGSRMPFGAEVDVVHAEECSCAGTSTVVPRIPRRPRIGTRAGNGCSGTARRPGRQPSHPSGC